MTCPSPRHHNKRPRTRMDQTSFPLAVRKPLDPATRFGSPATRHRRTGSRLSVLGTVATARRPRPTQPSLCPNFSVIFQHLSGAPKGKGKDCLI